MVRKAKSKPEETTDTAPEVLVEAPQVEAVKENITEPAPLSDSNCGGVLKHTREAQGLSVNDISNQLRLSTKQVEAIEQDMFELLPEPTIVRGFIRNYAKLLKIDAQPLLKSYSEIAPDTSPKSFAVKSNADTSIVIGENKASFSPTVFVALLVIFSLIGGVFYFYTQHISVKTPDTTTELATQAVPESHVLITPPAEFALPPAERTGESTDGSAQTTADIEHSAITGSESGTVTPLQLPSQTPEPATTPEAASSSVTPQAGSTTQTTPAATSQEQTGLAKLHITAEEESWINVIDASGNEVYSQILPAGSSRTIQAKPTLNVTIGNAAATTLTMNGKPIDLAPYTRDKVAHIKLD